ncbi:hypothetical protein R3P38DRAFT_3266759 [Favolaschia claudopus]|uniref:Uncharacterized protein n=1 Tax=Favolaschia claudopus TaxID=2862362 RepID=A0AAW0BST6_9AGAR
MPFCVSRASSTAFLARFYESATQHPVFIQVAFDQPRDQDPTGRSNRSSTHRLLHQSGNHVLHSTLQNLTIGVVPERESEMESPPEDVMADYIVPGNTLALLFLLFESYLRMPRSTGWFRPGRHIGFGHGTCLAQATDAPLSRGYNLAFTFQTLAQRPSGPRYPCPELDFIAIAFDASIVPLIDDSFESQGSQSSLTLSGLATFLSKLFPNLAKIHTFEDWMWSDLERQDPEKWHPSIDRSEYEQYTQWQWVEHLLKFPKDIGRSIVQEDSDWDDVW